MICHLPGWLDRRPMPPFAYAGLGSLISLGPYGAYGSLEMSACSLAGSSLVALPRSVTPFCIAAIRPDSTASGAAR